MPSAPAALRPTAPSSASGSVTPESYRSAFRGHPAGVAVVTLDDGGAPRGLTVSSFQSLSLEPPLVAFAVAATSSVWPSLARTDRHAVNLLGLDHLADARRFAASGIDRFAAPTQWSRLPDGQPVLDGARHWLHCAVEQRVEVGDHWFVVSRLHAIHVGAPSGPLVYSNGDFHTTARLLAAVDTPAEPQP